MQNLEVFCGGEQKYRSGRLTTALLLSLGLAGCMAIEVDEGHSKVPTDMAANTPSSSESPLDSLDITAEVSPEAQTPVDLDTPTPAPESPTPTPADTPTPTLTPTPGSPELSPESTPTTKGNVVDCMVKHCIALTFDDGPGEYTEQLLDHLDDYDAQATFFLVGSRLDAYMSVAESIHERGHQIGSHSWRHDNLTDLSVDEVALDTRDTNGAITSIVGVEPTVMRPPYGATDETVLEAVDMPQIMWSVDTADWKYRDSEYIANHVRDHAGRGDIILMHDIHKTTVEAVPQILENLTDRGYEIVTIDTMLGDNLSTGLYRHQYSGE